jgi:hypothetical protein
MTAHEQLLAKLYEHSELAKREPWHRREGEMYDLVRASIDRIRFEAKEEARGALEGSSPPSRPPANEQRLAVTIDGVPMRKAEPRVDREALALALQEHDPCLPIGDGMLTAEHYARADAILAALEAES